MCTLLIILFRMAQFLFIPQMSPLTPPALSYLDVMLRFTSHWLYLQPGCVDKRVPYFPGTTASWQLPTTCGGQNCQLVFKLAILSINVGYLVDYVLGFCGSILESRVERLRKCWRTLSRYYY